MLGYLVTSGDEAKLSLTEQLNLVQLDISHFTSCDHSSSSC